VKTRIRPSACVAQVWEVRSHPRFDEAEPLLSYSLAIREKVLGKDDASVAESLNNLAGLLLLQRRFRCVWHRRVDQLLWCKETRRESSG